MRGSLTLLTAVVLFTASVFAEDPKKFSDEQLTKKLVGKWEEEINEKGIEGKGIEELKADGSFVGKASIKAQGMTLDISATGTWKVEKGVLIYTIETAEPPVFPKGHVSKDTLLSISDNEVKVKSEQGRESVKKRIK